MKKWYLVVGGGLGDAVREYFLHNPIWGKLPAIKEKYPDSFIRLISVCHNPQVEELFRYHPYLDDKLYFPYEYLSDDKQREYKGDCVFMRNLAELFPLPWTPTSCLFKSGR